MLSSLRNPRGMGIRAGGESLACSGGATGTGTGTGRGNGVGGTAVGLLMVEGGE